MIEPGFEVPGDAGENIMRWADNFQIARLPVYHFRQVEELTSVIDGNRLEPQAYSEYGFNSPIFPEDAEHRRLFFGKARPG